MSETEENTEENKDKLDSVKRGRFEHSKRFVVMAAGLFLFFIVFGKIIPYLTLNKQPELQSEPQIELQSETQITKPQEVAEQAQPIQDVATVPVSQDDSRIRELEEKIASLQATHDAEVTELKNKIEQRDLEAQNKSNKIVSSLVAFSQLKDAVTSGKPYKTELNQFAKITEKNPEIESIISELEKDSATGIISIEALKIKFLPLIDAALAKQDQEYWRSVANKFITIRKIGERAGEDDESIFARAEIRLENNDFRAALKELEALTPPAKEVLSGWVAELENFLKTEENLSKLQLLLIPTEAASQL